MQPAFPSQKPLCLQVLVGSLRHSLSGSLDAAMLSQVPLAPEPFFAAVQALQVSYTPCRSNAVDAVSGRALGREGARGAVGPIGLTRAVRHVAPAGGHAIGVRIARGDAVERAAYEGGARRRTASLAGTKPVACEARLHPVDARVGAARMSRLVLFACARPVAEAVLLQLFCGSIAHSASGSAPAAMLPQVPSAPAPFLAAVHATARPVARGVAAHAVGAEEAGLALRHRGARSRPPLGQADRYRRRCGSSWSTRSPRRPCRWKDNPPRDRCKGRASRPGSCRTGPEHGAGAERRRRTARAARRAAARVTAVPVGAVARGALATCDSATAVGRLVARLRLQPLLLTCAVRCAVVTRRAVEIGSAAGTAGGAHPVARVGDARGGTDVTLRRGLACTVRRRAPPSAAPLHASHELPHAVSQQ